MSAPLRKLQEPEARPIALHDRAMDNLRFIRETMERSASFTHVSGIGGVIMGSIALTAAAIASRVATAEAWLGTWLVAALLSLGVAVVSMDLKSRSDGERLLNGAGRKFAKNVIPPLAAGGILTIALGISASTISLLPGVWLLLYGTSVVTGGSYSVRPVPLMGGLFMVLGTLALLTPATLGNVWMAVGFGGLHIVFGVWIWRRHGG